MELAQTYILNSPHNFNVWKVLMPGPIIDWLRIKKFLFKPSLFFPFPPPTSKPFLSRRRSQETLFIPPHIRRLSQAPPSSPATPCPIPVLDDALISCDHRRFVRSSLSPWDEHLAPSIFHLRSRSVSLCSWYYYHHCSLLIDHQGHKFIIYRISYGVWYSDLGAK